VASFSKILGSDLFSSFLKENSLKTPRAVQERCIPPIMEGRNVVFQSPTGSGKTLAYCLPIINNFKEIESSISDRNTGAPYAVILTPTKELSIQVESSLKGISHHVKFRSRSIRGGMSTDRIRQIASGPIDVLCANPGKLVKLLSEKKISLSHVQMLVLDEADQLFDQGFSKEIEKIMAHLPGKVQVVLSSATLNVDFQMSMQQLFGDRSWEKVFVGGKEAKKLEIETFNIHLQLKEKSEMAKLFLSKEGKGKGIIFTASQTRAMELHKLLSNGAVSREVFLIHGDMSARKREQVFKKFSDNKKSLLVATDIAARGWDFEDVHWVLNFDFPKEAAYYIHRAGRVGRKTMKGVVFNFVTPKDEKIIEKINQSIKSQDALLIKTIRKRSGGNQSGGAKKKATKKASSRNRNTVADQRRGNRKKPIRRKINKRS
jgi:superfamily II DNA/RNA helicase